MKLSLWLLLFLLLLGLDGRLLLCWDKHSGRLVLGEVLGRDATISERKLSPLHGYWVSHHGHHWDSVIVWLLLEGLFLLGRIGELQIIHISQSEIKLTSIRIAG